MAEVIKVEEKNVSVVKAQTTKALSAANDYKITNADDLAKGTDLLKKIKDIGKAVTERKKEITDPLNNALKSARDLFRPIEQNYAEAERIVKNKILEWQRVEDERIKKEQNKIATKVESGKMSLEKAVDKMEDVGTVQTSAKGKTGAISTREIPKYEVTEENKVPREYCSPDMAKIKRALDAGIEVPGARKYYEKVISAR